MATLVETGYKPPTDHPTMHPFFRPAQRRPQPPPPTVQDTVATTSDNEESRDDAVPSGNATPHGFDGVNDRGDDFDLNASRRKRRKVTPMEPGQPIQPTGQDNESWLQQLKSAADDVVPEATETTVFTESPTLKGPGNEPTPPPVAAQMPLPRPQTPSFRDTPVEKPADGPVTDASATPTKMLKLAGGKLKKSSKNSPKSDAIKKDSPRRSTRQARNLTMKKGRIVQSLQINIPYRDITEDRAALGAKIDAILEQPPQPTSRPDAAPTNPRPNTASVQRTQPAKILHPFFSGKPVTLSSTTDNSNSQEQAGSKPARSQASKPATAWKDIIFSSSKTTSSKDAGTLLAPWPPLNLQQIPHFNLTTNDALTADHSARSSKQKKETIHLSEDESVLSACVQRLRVHTDPIHRIRSPQQMHLRGEELLQELYNHVGCRAGFEWLRDQIRYGRSAFDRGMTAGPLDWTHEYAPKRSGDVLQQDSLVLKDWLKRLKVHNVQSKLAQRQGKKNLPRKKRAKKRPDDLDDFLVSSDDEDENGALPVKNAVLICGPHGVGKTASVFAAARELDYEVFEIHSGMRRTAKDIYDKVGDMTHNHLVQATASAPRSRASSVLSDSGHQSEDASALDTKQKSLAVFVGSKPRTPHPLQPTPDKESSQKQSLILIEEVDVLFDEDKTFWAGVQSLIATSKRPIVLTCNSLEDVDLSELSLHAVLHYSHPEIGKAVEQLGHIAAAEGHVIDALALRTLYMSRGQDLRAAIADLNFWCQMTVGSSMGGLDWMRGGSGRPEIDTNDYRIVSKDTFYDGLHLVPEQQLSPADMLAFAQHSLGLNVMEWEAARSPPFDSGNASKTRLSVLEEADMVAAFQSCMDIADPDLQPTMSCLLSEASPARKANITRAELAQFLLSQNTHLMVGRAAVYEALIPLTEDLRTFPPPAGRTAPSLDNKGLSIATEVAPYVRHIVWLDQQMEKQRAEIDASSQGTGRQRKTRAARAALEGGDVANTRVDRWFPKDLEFSVVLETGGRWHNELEWVEFEAPSTLSRESTDVTMVEMD